MKYMRSTSSPDSTSTTDPIVNSLMQELRSMKLTTGIDACSKSGDSGFLSSGDSSVNGDACSSNASVIMRVNSGSSNNSSGNVWGQKTIWGVATTNNNVAPTVNSSNDNNISFNNSKESIWSAQSPPLSGNSLWENNYNKQSNNASNNNANNKSQDAEWLGSIWMIPQTPQTNVNVNVSNANNNHNTKLSSYSSKLNAIWDTPDSYQNFKADLQQPQPGASTGEFQLLRPHDIGRNMWNNSTAAAVMNSVTKQESVSAIWAAPSPAPPTPVQRPTMPQMQQSSLMRANPPVAPKSYPAMPMQQHHQQQQQLQQQQQHITNTNNNGIIAGNHHQMSMQNNCYSQLFSDDFLNSYLNIIN